MVQERVKVMDEVVVVVERWRKSGSGGTERGSQSHDTAFGKVIIV